MSLLAVVCKRRKAQELRQLAIGSLEAEQRMREKLEMSKREIERAYGDKIERNVWVSSVALNAECLEEQQSRNDQMRRLMEMANDPRVKPMIPDIIKRHVGKPIA